MTLLPQVARPVCKGRSQRLTSRQHRWGLFFIPIEGQENVYWCEVSWKCLIQNLAVKELQMNNSDHKKSKHTKPSIQQKLAVSKYVTLHYAVENGAVIPDLSHKLYLRSHASCLSTCGVDTPWTRGHTSSAVQGAFLQPCVVKWTTKRSCQKLCWAAEPIPSSQKTRQKQKTKPHLKENEDKRLWFGQKLAQARRKETMGSQEKTEWKWIEGPGHQCWKWGLYQSCLI